MRCAARRSTSTLRVTTMTVEDSHDIDPADGPMTPATYCAERKRFRLSILGVAVIPAARSLVLTYPQDSARPHWIGVRFVFGMLLIPAVIYGSMPGLFARSREGPTRILMVTASMSALAAAATF